MANNRSKADYEAALQNPNVQAALEAIAQLEGTASQKNPYATGFGYSKISSLDDHPRVSHKHKGGTTSAAGKFQFQKGTWDGMAAKLGLTDFGKQSQDLAAVALMDRRGMLDDVIAGDIGKALKSAPAGHEWESLKSGFSRGRIDSAVSQALNEAFQIASIDDVPTPEPSPRGMLSQAPTGGVLSQFNAPVQARVFGQPAPDPTLAGPWAGPQTQTVDEIMNEVRAMEPALDDFNSGVAKGPDAGIDPANYNGILGTKSPEQRAMEQEAQAPTTGMLSQGTKAEITPDDFSRAQMDRVAESLNPQQAFQRAQEYADARTGVTSAPVQDDFAPTQLGAPPQETQPGPVTPEMTGIGANLSYGLEPNVNFAGLADALNSQKAELTAGVNDVPQQVGILAQAPEPQSTYAGVLAQHVQDTTRGPMGKFGAPQQQAAATTHAGMLSPSPVSHEPSYVGATPSYDPNVAGMLSQAQPSYDPNVAGMLAPAQAPGVGPLDTAYEDQRAKERQFAAIDPAQSQLTPMDPSQITAPTPMARPAYDPHVPDPFQDIPAPTVIQAPMGPSIGVGKSKTHKGFNRGRAAKGAAIGSAFGPLGVAIGGVLGGFMGGKKGTPTQGILSNVQSAMSEVFGGGGVLSGAFNGKSRDESGMLAGNYGGYGRGGGFGAQSYGINGASQGMGGFEQFGGSFSGPGSGGWADAGQGFGQGSAADL